MNKPIKLVFFISVFMLASANAQGQGKLIATSGVGSVEGTAGGGIIPWAPLGSYATSDEWGMSATSSRAEVKDFSLSSTAVTLGLYDRVELSIAHMDFQAAVGGSSIVQNVFGVKYRLMGDLIYDDYPVVSLGLQHKSLRDTATAKAVGGKDTSGTDFYISTAKVWLDGVDHLTTFANVNLRYSNANQLGILGFGGDDEDRHWMLELAAALFINPRLAIGFEYRQKPDNLSALKEEDWSDLFVAYFPSKSVSLTAAFLDLGDIAGQPDQTGFYFSITGSY
jgi:hypothetical protein